MTRRLASNRSARWAFMERFDVPDYDHPERNYLTRIRLIQTPWFGIYLHRFDGPDPRPTLHDHPWGFRSLVLIGGYVEALEYADVDLTKARDGDSWRLPVNADPTWPAGTFRYHGMWATHVRGDVNRKRATDTHTIVHLLRVPTWTLMLVGRRRREWGYVDVDGEWTRFDLHPHAAEFDAAMAARARRR